MGQQMRCGGVDDEVVAALLALGARPAIPLGWCCSARDVGRRSWRGGPSTGPPPSATCRAGSGTSMLPGIADSACLGDARGLIEAYSRLGGEDAVAVVRASEQYADVLWWADLDPRISWIKLVGAAGKSPPSTTATGRDSRPFPATSVIPEDVALNIDYWCTFVTTTGS